MTQVAEGVFFIPGRDDLIPDSHTYIIGDPLSGDLSMIDPGLIGKGRYKLESIKKLGIDTSEIKRIIMTHTHLDHIGCLSEILEQLPSAELWVHRIEGDSLERGDERTVYGMEMFKNMCQAQYGIKSGVFRFNVDRKLEDGERLEIGAMQWDVMHIPGHSSGSIALYKSGSGILIPGDVVYADYAIGRFDLYGADGDELKASLRRLSNLDVNILLPGHNEIAGELPPGYISETLRQWEPYLR